MTTTTTAAGLAETLARFEGMRDLARRGVQYIDEDSPAARWASDARTMFAAFEKTMTGSSDGVWAAAREFVGFEGLEGVFVLLRNGFLFGDDEGWTEEGLEMARQRVGELETR